MLSVQYDVEKVHTHAPGWNDEWGRILAHLIESDNSVPSSDPMDGESEDMTDDESEDIFDDAIDDDHVHTNKEFTYDFDPFERRLKKSAFLKCCYKIVNKNSVKLSKEKRYLLFEDFSSYVICIYQERVNKQNLFTDYDPKQGSVIQYLCSMTRLQFYFYDFKRSNKRLPAISIDETISVSNEDGNTVIDRVPSKEKRPEEKYEEENRQNNINRLLNDIDSMVVNCPRKGTRMYEQTGLQLYPRLNIKNAEMIALCQSSRDMVSKAHCFSSDDSDSMIRQRHTLLETSYREKIMNLQDKLYLSQRLKWSTQKVLAEKINLLYKQYYFYPLEARDISELCGVSLELAFTYRSRYIKEIPIIMEQYINEYDSLNP